MNIDQLQQTPKWVEISNALNSDKTYIFNVKALKDKDVNNWYCFAVDSLASAGPLKLELKLDPVNTVVLSGLQFSRQYFVQIAALRTAVLHARNKVTLPQKVKKMVYEKAVLLAPKEVVDDEPMEFGFGAADNADQKGKEAKVTKNVKVKKGRK
jgi:hypothetical protein